MATPTRPDASETAPTPAAPPRRSWVKPVLVEYGHLAKLTRGSSGTVTESGGKKKSCL